MKSPCAQCPFKQDSEISYDEDAHACLEDGDEPACHMQVGANAIFHHAPMSPPEGRECAGYIAWIEGKPGFDEPKHGVINETCDRL
jgi:hypothetical protein